MKQVKLPIAEYKYDVIVKSDYTPDYTTESFETMEGAVAYKAFLIKKGITNAAIVSRT